MSPGSAPAAMAVMAALLVGTPLAARAQTETPAERRRREIQEQLRIPRQPGPPKPAPAPPPAPDDAPEAPAAPAEDTRPAAPGTAPPAAPARPPAPGFAGAIHDLLLAGCRSCHSAGGSAAASRFILRGAAAADYQATRAMVDRARPRASLLLTKGAGELHGGGQIYAAGSRAHRQLLGWIAGGARLEPAADEPAPGAEGAPAAAAPPRPSPPRAAPQRRRSPAAAPPDPAPPTPSPPVAAPEPEPPAAPAPAPTTAPTPSTPAAPPVPDFARVVYPALAAGCQGCHNPAGNAATSKLRLSGVPAADYPMVKSLVDQSQPAQSPLVTKGAGVMHGGGAIYRPGSQPYQMLVAWIAAGAPEAPPPPPAPVAAAPPGPEGPEAPSLPAAPPPPSGPPDATVGVAAAAPPPGAGAVALDGRGLRLPFGLHLNGRFDLNYERHGLGQDTSLGDSKPALRSYHQFLFLSRQGSGEPLGFTVELIGLQIWEASYTRRFERVPLALVARAGKILVPFGTEPLFHQLYGGLAGFDQRVLPPIWAQEGVAEQLVLRLGRLSLSSDLYVVRGYRVTQPDAVLNLQNAFSPLDEVKVGAGHRLGVGWGPLTGWYSLYFNPLGQARRLLMQAVDLGIWRWRGIPVVDRLALSAGFLRADVSGGGSGSDYYHFASYWQARAYLTDWLALQYRQGLRTFNNKRGRILDETRLEADDGSTHAVGLVARWRGLSGGLHHYWNFEKTAEIDDDFLRATVAFEF